MWILLSVLAPVAWALGNVGDKYIFSKWIKLPVLSLACFVIVGAVSSIVIYFTKGFAPTSNHFILLSLLTGLIYLVANWFYYQAVQGEEISRIIAIIYLEPLFTAIISAVWLNELFPAIKYFGVILMVLGSIVISYKKSSGFKFNRAVWMAIVGSIIFSINSCITKYLVGNVDFWTVYSYARLGSLIGFLPFSYFYLKPFKDQVLASFKSAGFIFINNIFSTFGVIFFVSALSLGYVTLTMAISALQPFFVLLITLGLSHFAPQFFKEDISKKIVIQKVFAIALMFIGIILIT